MNKAFFYHLAKIKKIIPLRFFMKLTGQHYVLPFYHAVSDHAPIHLKHLYPVRNTKQFEKDLDFFLKNGKPINIQQFTSFVVDGAPLKKGSFMLSFDDGLREFYEVAAPVLLRKGIPAICFLNSNFIDNKDLFFRFKTSILIEKLQSGMFSHGQEKDIKNLLYSSSLFRNDIITSLYQVNYANKNMLDEIAAILDISFHNYLVAEKPYMTTGEIDDLKTKGFSFGSHSVDHPLYSELDIQQQLHQTQTSTNTIVNLLKLDYKAFSFPFSDTGVSRDFFNQLYTNGIVDISFGTSGLKKDSCKKNIQRIPIETNNFTAQEVVYGEYIYYMLKALFDKNLIVR